MYKFSVVPFSVIARFCYRSKKGPDLHAMLIESYFDDSSDPRREKYYACGGLMGNQEQWDLFDILWNTETQGLEKPFRATECECQHGQFKDWTKPRCDELMARLVRIITGLRLFGFASIVPIVEFGRVFPNLNSQDAFLLAVTQTIMNMAHIAHGADMDAELWFEKGQNNGAIVETFNSIGALDWKPARRLRGIHLEPKELRPLQSADLIAREAFKHIDNLNIRPTRIPVRRMSDTLFFILWTEGALEHLAANGGPKNMQFLGSFEDAPDGAKLKHFWKK